MASKVADGIDTEDETAVTGNGGTGAAGRAVHHWASMASVSSNSTIVNMGQRRTDAEGTMNHACIFVFGMLAREALAVQYMQVISARIRQRLRSGVSETHWRYSPCADPFACPS